ncbi:universal stress protein UspA [Dictyobacter vulcani]|uniref:Universal stress protein UspA n=1 Tax=Dictyobacter vulcani TaxID=2607529 RepID=A0A5J4KZP2_9CHLR|nr:universal stress protein [Dictyobacter vulcani]GER90696.1 universal stress protein UspA [Dictyobacter vulcani]
MFKHILVPLDGSIRSEQALPVAARIARATQASLLLLETINPVDEMGLSSLPQEQRLLEMEHTYLQNIASGPELTDIAITTHSRIGIPAEQILLAADQHHIDLIVMCSHGRTGLKRWAMGSVTQKVSRSSPVPVLVLKEDDPLMQQLRASITAPVHIMVALDGSPLAEKALAPAAYLCMALSAPSRGTLQLTEVIHLPAAFEYGQEDSVSIALKKETPLAQTYLQSVKQRLQEGKFGTLPLEITTMVSHDLDIAAKLLRLAEHGEEQQRSQGCQLIALTTHGRSGLQRWVIGSVTERILSKACMSLLVVTPTSGE